MLPHPDYGPPQTDGELFFVCKRGRRRRFGLLKMRHYRELSTFELRLSLFELSAPCFKR